VSRRSYPGQAKISLGVLSPLSPHVRPKLIPICSPCCSGGAPRGCLVAMGIAERPPAGLSEELMGTRSEPKSSAMLVIGKHPHTWQTVRPPRLQTGHGPQKRLGPAAEHRLIVVVVKPGRSLSRESRPDVSRSVRHSQGPPPSVSWLRSPRGGQTSCSVVIRWHGTKGAAPQSVGVTPLGRSQWQQGRRPSRPWRLTLPLGAGYLLTFCWCGSSPCSRRGSDCRRGQTVARRCQYPR
jgi:hypothetical protein